MTFNTRKAAESAQQVADNVLSSAQATIGKTRSIADAAIDAPGWQRAPDGPGGAFVAVDRNLDVRVTAR